MIKNKGFFLLVLFSLGALNSSDHKHEKCERKRSLTEKVIRIAVVSFIVAHLYPILDITLGSPSKIKRLAANPLGITKAALPEMKSKFVINSGGIPLYFLAIASAQALTALISKPIF